MILCMFVWPIQSHLAIPPGARFAFRSGVREVYITCETMQGAKLFSYTGEEYGWLTGAYEIHKRHIKARSPAHNEVVIRRVYQKADEAWFTGGIADPVKYTRVYITFEIESTDVLDDDRQFKGLRDQFEQMSVGDLNTIAIEIGEVANEIKIFMVRQLDPNFLE